MSSSPKSAGVSTCSERQNRVSLGSVGRKTRKSLGAGNRVGRYQGESVGLGVAAGAGKRAAGSRSARHLVFDGLVERVRGMIGFGQHTRPSRTGPLKDQLDVLLLLLEIVGGGQRVEHAAEGFLAPSRIGEHDDGGLFRGHDDDSLRPGMTKRPARPVTANVRYSRTSAPSLSIAEEAEGLEGAGGHKTQGCTVTEV